MFDDLRRVCLNRVRSARRHYLYVVLLVARHRILVRIATRVLKTSIFCFSVEIVLCRRNACLYILKRLLLIWIRLAQCVRSAMSGGM